MAENLTSKPFAYAQRSGFRRDDYTVEWPDSSVGMLTEGEAKMWAAHMNEAYEAGRRALEPSATLKQEIASALNRHCAENRSNTPDFILAKYLIGCLNAFDVAVNMREDYYGREHHHLGNSVDAPALGKRGDT